MRVLDGMCDQNFAPLATGWVYVREIGARGRETQ